MRLRADMGMSFQEIALFDSLTVAENVGYRLYEETALPLEQVRQRVEEILGFIGLAEYIDRMPSELSGGQRRRVAIARAMASRPSLLLFDDPTTGLDPIIANTVDDELVKLRGVECWAVAWDEKDPFDSLVERDADPPRGGVVVAAVILVKQRRAVCTCDRLRPVICADHEDSVDRTRPPEGHQHIGEHRLRKEAARSWLQRRLEPLLRVAKALDRQDRDRCHRRQNIRRRGKSG